METTKSVRYLEGSFFADDWTEVFIPLNREEHDMFLLRVHNAELAAKRKLTTQELQRIGQFMNSRGKQ